MNEHGFPLNTQKLYPAVVINQKVFGKHAIIMRLIRSYVTFQLQKGLLKNYNQNALYHLRMTERENIRRNWKPWGTTASTEYGKKLHIDYLAREFMWQSDDVVPVLKLNDKVIAYRNSIGKGSNTVFGTPLGARYVIDSFYRDSKKIKQQNREFLEDMLAIHNVHKTFNSNVEIEIVCRFNKEKKSLFVFLLNRGKKNNGTISVLIPAKTRLPKKTDLKVEVIYKGNKSEIDVNETTLEKLQRTGIHFKIKKDDTLVLRISPKKSVVKTKKEMSLRKN